MTQTFAILGAGITGLTLGWQLKKKHPQAEILIIEQSSRIGGWIDTRLVDGFLFEMGPRSLRSKGAGTATLKLVEELNLQDQVIMADKTSKIRYIYENKQLTPLPHSFSTFLFSPYLPLFLKALLRDWRVKSGKKEDLSIFDFASLHFGNEVAERFIDPLTQGIYAGNSRQLSLEACFPLWAKWDASHGSLLKAALSIKKTQQNLSPWIKEVQKSPIFSFQEGMKTLVEALAHRLQGSILLNSEAVRLNNTPDGIEVVLSNGQTVKANRAYSTLPLNRLSLLTGISLPQVESGSVAVVSMGFNKQVLKKQGFGYLIPTKEKESILGMVWDSSAFPQQNSQTNQTRLTVMIKADTSLSYEKIAREVLTEHLQIHEPPHTLHIKVTHQSIPHYPIGYKQIADTCIKQCAMAFPKLSLLGTGFNGVAVNDCIKSAIEAVDNEKHNLN